MSLNEKYIINGSTLSDIGNALRTSGIIPATKEVTKSIWYKKTSDSASGNGSSTRTIDQSFFQQGNAVWDGTIVKVKIVITNGNPKINSTQYYSGNTVTVNVPCTINISGSIMYPSNTYSYTCKIFPLTSDGQNIDCTQKGNSGGIYSENGSTTVPNTIAVEDIATSILQANGITIDYEGLSYSYVTRDNPSKFGQDTTKWYWVTFVPLTSGQKVGFCVGETVQTRLRAAFFQGKVYSDFQQYVTQPASSDRTIYTGGINITGTTELTGDSLLKRLYYTAPSDGELIVMTSNNSKSAPLRVWRA